MHHRNLAVRLAAWAACAMGALGATLSAGRTELAARSGTPAVNASLGGSPAQTLPAGRLTYGQLPLSFEPNKGQGDADDAFVAHGRGYILQLSGREAVLTLSHGDESAVSKGHTDFSPLSPAHQIRLQFAGSRADALGRGEGELPGKVHYLTGNDPAAWRTNVPTYATVRYDRVYPGVDLVYYGTQGELEYDFVVAPGADPNVITLSFEGVDTVKVDEAGNLMLSTAAGVVRQHKPLLYQDVDGRRRAVTGRYRLDGTQVRFEVGTYDSSRVLVIDPVLVFSGGVGGASATGVAVDASGNAYVSGFTHDPSTVEGGEVGVHGGRDALVRKINPAGTAVLWTAFVGGSRDDWAYAIAIDAAGSAYITGATRSLDFPTLNAFDFSYNGPTSTTSSGDAFVAKLTPDGSALAYSTYLGTTGDDRATGIAVRDGNAYVVGGAWAGFPTTPGAFQVVKPGTHSKGFVTQLNATGSALVYSTYLGAPSNGSPASGGYPDAVRAIALDSDGNAYVTGVTQSYNFPTVNPAQAWSTVTTFSQDGRNWAFISKLNPTGSALVYSTYLGGGLSAHGPLDNYVGTEGNAIAIDAGGNAYVTGATRDANFPTTSTAFDKTCPVPPGGRQGCLEAFVTKVSADGATFVYSSYLGGTDASIESGHGIAVDVAGRAHVTGATFSLDFPLVDAFQTTGGAEAFFTVVNPTGTGLEYSTFLGGATSSDIGQAIALDASRNAYIVGQTVSSDFPRVGPLPPAGGGNVNSAGGFIAKFSAIGCGYAVAPSANVTAPAAGSSGVTNVTTTPGCGWGTTSTVPWLTLTPASGDGPAGVTFTVAPNASTNPRTGTFTVANTTIVVQQSGIAPGTCTYNLSPSTNIASPAVGASGTISVTTAASCAWEATSTVPWATPGAGRTGSGPVTYTIAPNLTASSRTGSLFIGGQTVQVNQAAGPATNCTADVDCDGLPTAWETQFGLDANSPDGAAGAAGDADGDGFTNAQEFAAGTHPRGLFRRYFAEGATGSFFDSRLALVNPGSTTAHMLLRFLTGKGAVVSHSLAVGPTSRATVQPRQIAGLIAAEFSTVVESDEPIVADRTMTWGLQGYGSHAETSVPAPSSTWYLAEGATHSGFNLFYLIQNPGGTAAEVQVSYLLPPPTAPIVKTYQVNANSRFNIWVNQEGGALASTDVSAVITSTGASPIIVERAMYLDTAGQQFGAGHNSAGVTAPSTRWFLAEGATGDYFDMFVLIANPNASDATVTATYLLPSGQTLTKDYVVSAKSRFNIWVDHEDAALANTAVSTTLVSTSPVIVERSMWWPSDGAHWFEAHNSFGATVTGTRWALAEGEVGGAQTTETYVLIANTSAFAGSAAVTILFEDGTTATDTYPLAASSRFNVDVRSAFPQAVGRRFGVVVESIGTSPAQIVVERAMYSNAGAVRWAAGTNALATRLQ